MKALTYLLGGAVAGAGVAALWPAPTTRVVQAIDDSAIVHPIVEAALALLPAGDDRDASSALIAAVGGRALPG